MSARSPERAEFLSDIIVTAIEGGTNYWASVGMYKWEGREANVIATIYDFEGDTPDAPLQLNNDVIARGIRIALNDETSLHKTSKQEIRWASQHNDAGEIDATLADVIVQCAVFGNVIYG